MKFANSRSAILAILCCIQGLFSQQITLKGTVNDSKGLPLPGTNIILADAKKGAQTDFDGNFEIEAAIGDKIEFSYVGFFPKTITIENDQPIQVVLVENIEGLEQVVVIGYGTTRRKKLSTSIGSIKAQSVEDIEFPSIQSVFNGQVTGVQVAQTTGRVESGIKVRIRGASTIGASQEPLYVLDGVPLINLDDSTNNSPINPLIGISADDIESIDFLKDAAAAAIYGARGTNGVVIITTKKGKTTRPTIQLNTYTGVNFTTRKRKFLNAAQYVQLFREAATNAGVPIANVEQRFDQFALGKDWRNGEVDTDWQDFIFRQSYSRNIHLSASGGSKKTKYYASTSYNKNEGIILGNALDRYTFRGRMDTDFSDRSKIGFGIGVSKLSIDRISNDNAVATPLQSLAQSPLTPALLDDGKANITPTSILYQNFLGDIQTGRFVTDIWRTTANIYNTYYFSNSLKLTSEIGYDSNNQNAERFSGSLSETPSGSSEYNNANTERYIITNYLNFSESIGNSVDFSTTIGGSFEETNRVNIYALGSGTISDDLQTVDNSETNEGGSRKTKYNFISYFARAKIDLSYKYALTASIRRDGSSRFGKDSQFGWFPAVSGSWTLSNEDFMEDSKYFTNLKIRASWGLTGNAGIGDFSSRNLISPAIYDGNNAALLSQLGDPQLRWEKTDQYNIGLDFNLVKNMLSGEFDYYQKTTQDLLFDQLLPATSGFSTIKRTVGEIQNKGFEARLNSTLFARPNFVWELSALYTFNDNEVTDLPNGDVIDDVNILRTGESLSSFYLFEYAGVDPANGDALYHLNTENPDGSLNKGVTNDITKAKRIVAGASLPNQQASLNSAMKLYNVDFSFVLQGEFGASIYDSAGEFTSGNAKFFDNQTIDQLDRWQQPGDITDVPQARLGLTNGQTQSTRYLEKVDFIRLRNVSLGYTINKNFTKEFFVEKVRFYFSASNLFTFTDYKGFDPQSTADIDANNAGIRNGNSFYSAPPSKTFLFGVNVAF